MNHTTVVLLHGYGVRGFFWDPMQQVLAERGVRVHAPDLEMSDIDDGLRQIAEVVRHEVDTSGAAVTLVGHSLGGVLAALSARALGAELVARVGIISSPFGRVRRGPLAPLLRLALATGLIPADRVRPRFFGPDIPVDAQRALFDRAVREQPHLRRLPWQREWFHTRSFPEGLPQPAVVVASAADQVVPVDQTRAFAAALGADYHEFPAEDGMGHDDIGVSLSWARRVTERILPSGAAVSSESDSDAGPDAD